MKRVWVASVSIAVWCAACPGDEKQPPLTQGVTVEEHEAYFPIGPNATHVLGQGDVSCQYCHGGGETYKEFFCTRCHSAVAGAHSQVSGFENDNAACYACHPDGKAGSQGFTHLIFPVFDDAAHSPDNDSYMDRADAQPEGHTTHCTSCHVDYEEEPEETRCAECHADDTGPTIDGLHGTLPVDAAYNAINDCKACHWTTPLPDMIHVSEHNSSSCMNHYNVDSCFDCHEQEYQGGDLPWALDFDMPSSPMTCAVCHPSARAYPAACP